MAESTRRRVGAASIAPPITAHSARCARSIGGPQSGPGTQESTSRAMMRPLEASIPACQSAGTSVPAGSRRMRTAVESPDQWIAEPVLEPSATRISPPTAGTCAIRAARQHERVGPASGAATTTEISMVFYSYDIDALNPQYQSPWFETADENQLRKLLSAAGDRQRCR